MRIGEVSKRSGVPVKTIRYYEETGVLAAPRRSGSGYRDYESEAVNRLGFIRASQAFGLSLGEIREIAAYRDRGEVPCAHVLALLRRHSQEIDERIAVLQHVRSALDGLVSRARKLRPEDCSPSSVCHLIPKGNGPAKETNRP
ncbi:MAG: heavy metal-responsive transcriptional regulator [Candidatus Dormibacteraeota bacterium]|nr:heavy metal-responsive transcriptional regulator [Actinomycetota bacterium]MDA8393869.1 heavy metal-responsive transcriptional regulator [Candidatus Dormibacteraeota bacterium]